MDDAPDTRPARGLAAARAERVRIQRVRWFLDAEERREAVHGGWVCSCDDCDARRTRTHHECACCGAALRQAGREPGDAMCAGCRDIAAQLQQAAGAAVPGTRTQLAEARAAVHAARSAIHRSRAAAEARRNEAR